jgi:hypothetical protein
MVHCHFIMNKQTTLFWWLYPICKNDWYFKPWSYDYRVNQWFEQDGRLYSTHYRTRDLRHRMGIRQRSSLQERGRRARQVFTKRFQHASTSSAESTKHSNDRNMYFRIPCFYQSGKFETVVSKPSKFPPGFRTPCSLIQSQRIKPFPESEKSSHRTLLSARACFGDKYKFSKSWLLDQPVSRSEANSEE